MFSLALLFAGCGDDDAVTPGTDSGPGGGPDGGPGIDAGPGEDSGGGAPDAGPRYEEPPLGPAITAPDGDWTWVPIEGTRCMNDTETGIGVNLSATSPNVVIFLEGGGACFNAFTCFTVAHQGGYGPSDFASTVRSYGGDGIFDRTDTSNPVRDWNFVFVPYCSGDVFAGLTETGASGRVQVGYHNMGLVLARLVPTFMDADKVLLTGSSAGGFGAAWNFDRTQQRFGDTEVILLDDSGPPMADEWMKPCLQQRWRDSWNLDATMPADCTACRGADGGGISNFSVYLAEKYPTRRFGLISSTQDEIIRTFFGIGETETCNDPARMRANVFTAGLLDLRDRLLAPHTNFRGFLIPGTQHVWLGDPLSDTTAGGVTLAAWMTALIEGTPEFTNVGP
jgi:hypothetical protein